MRCNLAAEYSTLVSHLHSTPGPVATHIEWEHPNRGFIQELACTWHTTYVTSALRILGIGCAATPATDGLCLRCAHDGQDPRTYLSGTRP